MPRSGDLLVLLGTLCVPLLTPILRDPLERIGFIDKDIAVGEGFTSRLDWDDHLLPNITAEDRWLLGGLFLLTSSAAAFVGLQWRPKIWAICFGLVAAISLTLWTTEWTNLDGLVSGPWGSIDYWREEQLEGFRGDQPWYYYYLLMPAYEFLPLAVAAVGGFWAVFRGNAFSRFLVFWLVGQWLALSYGSEKMPWLNTHLAVPACLLAAWTVNRAWERVRGLPRSRATVSLAGSAVAAGLALGAIVLMPGGTGWDVARLGIAAVAAFAIAFTATPLGRRAGGAIAVAAVVGGLSFFSVRTMVDASFTRGDVPKDMLIYTQSSPQIPEVMDDIERLAEVTGKGRFLPIAVDGRDSFAWPWAWYLRDYKCVAYPDMTSGDPGTSFCQGEEQPYAVLLVNSASVNAVEEWIEANQPGTYGAPFEYPHRWWFPETYKDAVRVDGSFSCTAQAGDCGPFRPATWKEIFDGIRGGWLETWYRYWRDHDPDKIRGAEGDRACNSCGSVDGSAYFPPGYDFETGTYSVEPVAPPAPGVDLAGRPAFGGRGAQDGNFARPVDIEADAAGDLYVIDSSRRKLTKFDPAGNVLASVDVRTLGATSEDSEPWGLAVLDDGRVVVADTFGWRIRLFSSDLQLQGVYGETPTLDDGVDPLPQELFGPRDVAADAAGDLWVTDTGQDRIVVFGIDGTAKRTIGSEGAGDGQFNEPVGIDIAADGTVFVADIFNGRVVLLEPDGSFRSSFSVDGWGTAAEDKGYVEALADGRVAVSMPALGEVRVYERDGALAGTIAPADEPLSRPYGMVAAPDAKLWVVEGGAARVRQFPLP
jgi:sugar lactone lactonase YvrE